MATLQGKFQFKKVLSIDAEISQNVNFVSTTFFEDGSTRKLTCSAMYVVPGTDDATGHLDYTIEAVEPADGEEYPKTTEVYMDSELGWGADLVGQDVIVVVDFGDTPQDVSDEYANWVSRNTVTVSSENPAATVSYKGETLVAIAGGKSVTLRTNGKRMEDDLKIVALATGGSCDYECVIPVDELPTENIDTNAVYLCNGAYHKYVNEFADVIMVQDGEAGSYKELAPSQGLAVSFNTIPTKTTDGILETELGASFNFYYIEDEAGVFFYINPWMPMTDMGLTNGGVIANISEATTDGCYYALFESNWKTYICPVGPLAITDRGVYDVTDFASASVVIEDAAICGVWKFNDTIDAKSFPIVLGMGRQAVNFSTTVNGTTTNWVYMENGSGSYSSYLYYSDEATTAGKTQAYVGHTWNDEGYKTIDFGFEPQLVYSEFKEWLVANATPIYTITQTE